MESTPVRRLGRGRTLGVAWELLEFMREATASMEDGATRIAAVQVAGLIALWTQLGTFESGPPQVLAWIAWGLLTVSIALVGPIVTPRRLARFWERTVIADVLAVDSLDKEEQLIRAVHATMEGQMRRLRRGMRASVVFGVVALGIVVIAYGVEKAFYAP